jgi:fructokinase
MRFCDINLRPPFFNRESVEWSLRSADILKLNDDEARVTGELLNHPLQGLEDFCRWASAAFNIQTLCVTRGAEGCLVYRGGKAVRCPGVRVHVVDTVGSGDAFSAAFIARLLAGASAEQAGQFANKVGALVASRRGAVPEYDPREIEG